MREALKNISESDYWVYGLGEDDYDYTIRLAKEFAEAKILLIAIEKKEIPSSDDLGTTPEAYLNGLLDATGELKREMYECLRKGKRDDAEYYFSRMEKIYDELLPLKFSNALLPDFRRKQDVARMQIEQARGELL